MHPSQLSVHEFTYHLPDERIARFPLEQRDQSKLLVFKQGNISEQVFGSLPNLLPVDSTLVFNNSRVVEARMLFRKETGGLIEIFALEPHEQYPDITTAMNTCGRILYKCLVGGAGKWKPGMVLQKSVVDLAEDIVLNARVLEKRVDCFVVEFTWTPGHLPFASILHVLGQMPIPPYLNRPSEASDAERYQTVYASEDGSVAAPTAGLHFTPHLQARLQASGVKQAYVTLHVGAGTFMPVKSDTMKGHLMHAEFIDADLATLRILQDARLVIPVGTTSMRTIESLYWMGVKLHYNPGLSVQELEMEQWEVYDQWLLKGIPAADAFEALIQWMENRGMTRLIVKTRIMIAPGYVFGICKGLVTNFHQPQSTLLLLVAAMVGSDWKKIYSYAMENDFRFLSYGDSSLLLPAY